MKSRILLRSLVLLAMASCAIQPSHDRYHVTVAIAGGSGYGNSVPERAVVRVRAASGETVATATTRDRAAALDFSASASEMVGGQVEVVEVKRFPDGTESFEGTVTSFKGSGSYCVILPAGCVF